MISTQLISFGERLFRTDVRYVGRNGFWVVLGQSVTVLVGLGLSIAFANLLSQHEYGVYKFIFATASLLGALRLSGLQQAITQATARGYAATAHAAIGMSLRWSCLILIASLLIAGYYYVNGNLTLAGGILLASLANICIGTYGLYGGYLTGMQRFRTSTIHHAILVCTNAGAILGALYFTGDVLYITAAGAGATVISVFILAKLTLRNVARDDAQISHDSLRFGKHLSAQNAFVVGAQHIDKIILFQFLGSVELAIYAFAAMLPDQIRSVFKNILNLLIPRFSTKDEPALRQSIRQKVVPLTLLVCLPIAAYVVLAPFIFAWLFPAYQSAVLYSQLIAVGLVVIPAIQLMHTFFNVREETLILYYCKVISSVVKVMVIIIGVLLAGILGAAVALVISRVLQAMLFAYFYLRRTAPVAGSEA